ncbi:hypothetical protein BOX15_Mlig013910g1 [Macrostomum lignano]|uniref:Phosphoserine aminotransferase n=2 Tax=Macrostomum lignano TaxID=282301 RepID=A0A1I8IJY3_9PLAT|nr:hypothetical protein BOX15_Mlig013910g1 [Macrostomum lignano]
MAPTPVSAHDLSQKHKRVVNFSAGPSKLPDTVLQRAQEEMLNFRETGSSVMELSHRGKTFKSVISEAEKLTRQLLNVPDNFRILFMQGGGCGQFAAVPLNLAGSPGATVDYIVTGRWSESAAKEAEKYCQVRKVHAPKPHASDSSDSEDSEEEWWSELSENAAYVYMCDNETVDGVEFKCPPRTPPGVPLVADMSSNMMSRPIDFSKYGLVFAGAQKNLGPAGVTVVIVREDLMDGRALPFCPSVLSYHVTSRNDSLYNTPPTFSIYVTGLVMQWVRDSGGVARMQELSREKSSLLYNLIENSQGFYYCPVDKSCRSRMNIVFRLSGGEALEKRFAEEAAKQGLTNLEGHRSIGGLRASLYNAVTIADTRTLASFMRDFAKRVAQIDLA